MITKKFILEIKHRSTEASKHRSTVEWQGKQKTQPPALSSFFFRRFSLPTARQRGKIYAQVRE